jgi:hypothetical protein
LGDGSGAHEIPKIMRELWSWRVALAAKVRHDAHLIAPLPSLINCSQVDGLKIAV